MNTIIQDREQIRNDLARRQEVEPLIVDILAEAVDENIVFKTEGIWQRFCLYGDEVCCSYSFFEYALEKLLRKGIIKYSLGNVVKLWFQE